MIDRTPIQTASPHRLSLFVAMIRIEYGISSMTMKHILLAFAALMMVPLVGLRAADAPAKPLKVFILARQSNMEVQGIIKADPKRNAGKGTLEYLVKDTSTADRYRHLVDKDGKWVVREDVWIWYLGRKGGLTGGVLLTEEKPRSHG